MFTAESSGEPRDEKLARKSRSKKIGHLDKEIDVVDRMPSRAKSFLDSDAQVDDKLQRKNKRKRKDPIQVEEVTKGVDQDVAHEEALSGKEEAVVVNEPERKKKRNKMDNSTDVHSTEPGDTPISRKGRKDKKRKKNYTSPMTSILSTSVELSSNTSAEPNYKLSLSSTTLSPLEAKAFLDKHSVTLHTPAGVPSITPVIKFSQLDVPPEIQSVFAGFKEPTPIQACTWPPALDGKDVVGIAETGSGKTLAFGIPALCHLLKRPVKINGSSTISVLVVAPTRELALQTHDTLSTLGKPFGIASVAVFGGVPKEPQAKMLKNASKAKNGMTTRIIVGTPGRILDFVQEATCDLSQVTYLVLDEADRMLDKGFENDIRNIISKTRPLGQRQTMMFSATWPESVRRLATTFQQNPVRVTVGSDDLTANSRVEQRIDVFEDARSKDQRLLDLLRSLSHKKKRASVDESRTLVFALYKKEAARVEQMLQRHGYSVGSLHGDMSQTARMEALENFKNGETGLLVATDVAARGLDIPNVGAVINYTFPLTIEDYIHRIGRTGRGGQSGKSITFFTGDAHERALAGELARVLREAGYDYEALKKFPMTIRKKEHSAYGAFYRDDIPMPKGPTKIVF